MLQQLIIIVFGPKPVAIPTLAISSASVGILGVNVRVLAIVIIAVSAALMAGLTYLVKSTRIGKAMRATSQDMEAAEMMGIEAIRTIAFTFLVGSALAGIGGLLVVMYYGSLKYDAGFLMDSRRSHPPCSAASATSGRRCGAIVLADRDVRV